MSAQIIIRPIMTEKSLTLAARGWYTFMADALARKEQIASEIHDIYKVDVVDVRTMIMHGKTRRVGKKAKPTKKQDWKKTMVRLKPGQKISIFEIAPVESEPAA